MHTQPQTHAFALQLHGWDPGLVLTAFREMGLGDRGLENEFLHLLKSEVKNHHLSLLGDVLCLEVREKRKIKTVAGAWTVPLESLHSEHRGESGTPFSPFQSLSVLGLSSHC